MRQLTLGVGLHERAVFDSFLPGQNGIALAALRDLAAARGDNALYLHGVNGSGKSHLLQALCAAQPGSAYFPLRDLARLGPAVLEGAASLPLLALDDVQQVAGDAAWETALFGLYNERMHRGLRFAVAAAVPATDLPLQLADLRSRLAALAHFALHPLDEPQQREALRRRAQARGLVLPEDTLTFLQRHFARDMGRLCALLDQLDAASLAQQRRLTVPFIRQVLGETP
jgi:DnaA family protein